MRFCILRLSFGSCTELQSSFGVAVLSEELAPLVDMLFAQTSICDVRYEAWCRRVSVERRLNTRFQQASAAMLPV